MIKEILLIDDDADDVDLFREALNEVASSISCNSAKNGLKALEFLLSTKSTVPDLILLDINMPEMNGWQCLAELKSNSLLKEIPVLMYSTSATKMDAEKAQKLGASGIHQKPERFEDLKKLLKSLIKDY